MPDFLLTNMRIFDGLAPGLQTGKVVVVRGGLIQAILEDIERLDERYPGCERIDLQGLTLLPGLIDIHAQVGIPFIRRVNLRAILDLPRQLHNNLSWVLHSGVTTVRDMAGIPGVIQKLRREVEDGSVQGPRIFCANSFIGPRGGFPDMAPHFNPIQRLVMGGQFAERVSTPAEARDVVRRMVDLNADWIKTNHADRSFFAGRSDPLPIMSDECYRALVDEAHRLGRPVALHQTWLSGFRKGVEIGVQSLEHLPLDGEIPDELVEEVVRRKICVVPTMHVFTRKYLELDETERYLEEKGRNFLAREPYRQTRRLLKLLQARSSDPLTSRDECVVDDELFRRARDSGLIYANLRKLHQAGVRLGCGSDGGGELAFFGQLHEEMKEFVRAGLGSFVALKAATIGNASILGMEDRLGSIEAGKHADLIAVQGNPLENLDCLADVPFVMKGGVVEVIEAVLPSVPTYQTVAVV